MEEELRMSQSSIEQLKVDLNLTKMVSAENLSRSEKKFAHTTQELERALQQVKLEKQQITEMQKQKNSVKHQHFKETMKLKENLEDLEQKLKTLNVKILDYKSEIELRSQDQYRTLDKLSRWKARFEQSDLENKQLREQKLKLEAYIKKNLSNRSYSMENMSNSRFAFD